MPKRAKQNAQAVAAASAQPERIDIVPAAREPEPREREKPTIAEIFGPGGELEKYMPEGYEHRPENVRNRGLLPLPRFRLVRVRKSFHSFRQRGCGGHDLRFLFGAFGHRKAGASEFSRKTLNR